MVEIGWEFKLLRFFNFWKTTNIVFISTKVIKMVLDLKFLKDDLLIATLFINETRNW